MDLIERCCNYGHIATEILDVLWYGHISAWCYIFLIWFWTYTFCVFTAAVTVTHECHFMMIWLRQIELCQSYPLENMSKLSGSYRQYGNDIWWEFMIQNSSYLINCNHLCGKNYPSSFEKLHLVQKKVTRIVTCSSLRAHTEPLRIANGMLNVADINDYINVYV